MIGVLAFRPWREELWESIVIATDSEYATTGATEWAHKWVDNKWKKNNGQDVKNRDLCERLVDRIQILRGNGVETLFSRIPRELNQVADQRAKASARIAEQGK